MYQAFRGPNGRLEHLEVTYHTQSGHNVVFMDDIEPLFPGIDPPCVSKSSAQDDDYSIVTDVQATLEALTIHGASAASVLSDAATVSTLTGGATTFISPRFNRSCRGNFSRLHSEMTKNSVLQSQIFGIQRAAETMVKRDIGEPQQRTVHDAAAGVGSIGVCMVLPKEEEDSIEKLGRGFRNAFVKQFKLYFLCEKSSSINNSNSATNIGSNTDSGGAKLKYEPRRITIATHLTEFFEKYGTYVLIPLQMLKYGVTHHRIVTSHRHVKWVCLDHYRQNYRSKTTKELRDVVKSNGGQYDEHTGRVIVKDLRDLKDAIQHSNVVHLKHTGGGGQGPFLDVLNRAASEVGAYHSTPWQQARSAALPINPRIFPATG
ncbi:hypothetical protein KI688_010630 [Linnemannia hyalina]|uniref:Uncharacterized protein n=1 Tax=Linnemannia hyalina TaxID=64524 RepID=A0A9P7XXF6_9FUNG|nr:hypothetical protein KI688_010630 [Linnemannia hyalina]